MKLVIDISEELKEDFVNRSFTGSDCFEMGEVLEKGIPLPKGHGDLKDMDDIYEALEGWDNDTGWIVDAIDCQAETIIEAESEGER